MTQEEISQIKYDQKEFIHLFGYENNLINNIKLYVPEFSTYMVFEHYPTFIVESESYVDVIENIWHDEYIVSPGATLPIAIGRRLLNEIKQINALMSKELFTRQNQIDAIDYSSFATDQDFIDAVQAVVWTLDMDQIFDFSIPT